MKTLLFFVLALSLHTAAQAADSFSTLEERMSGKEFKETGDPRVIWEAHFAGIEIGYCHMEKLANLSAIGRSHGFMVCCFPINIKKASAGWVRPVAIIDEE